MSVQVIKPVNTCQECQTQFQEMKTLYSLYQACPSDPGATGLLQASISTYNQHHKEQHPVHPDAVTPQEAH